MAQPIPSFASSYPPVIPICGQRLASSALDTLPRRGARQPRFSPHATLHSSRAATMAGSRDQLDARGGGDRVEPDVRRFDRRFDDREDSRVEIGTNVAVQILLTRPLLYQQQGV